MSTISAAVGIIFLSMTVSYIMMMATVCQSDTWDSKKSRTIVGSV